MLDRAGKQFSITSTSSTSTSRHCSSMSVRATSSNGATTHAVHPPKVSHPRHTTKLCACTALLPCSPQCTTATSCSSLREPVHAAYCAHLQFSCAPCTTMHPARILRPCSRARNHTPPVCSSLVSCLDTRAHTLSLLLLLLLLRALQVSQRVLATDPPVIVKTKQLMAQAPPSKQVRGRAQGRGVHNSHFTVCVTATTMQQVQCAHNAHAMHA
jgi:hypothetical protein